MIRYQAVVYWLKALIGSLCQNKDLSWHFLDSEAFNLYTTQSVQNKSKLVSYMGFLLIDSWDLNKQDK